MRCPACGLPDSFCGDGDGIGSCDCARCDCCGAGPDECDCRRDLDPLDDQPDDPFDPLCNDTACDYRDARLFVPRPGDAVVHAYDDGRVHWRVESVEVFNGGQSATCYVVDDRRCQVCRGPLTDDELDECGRCWQRADATAVRRADR